MITTVTVFELSFSVNYSYDGKYYPATREQPEEFPELVIGEVLFNGEGDDIADKLTEKYMNAIVEAVESENYFN